jgi:hypothetical protein
MKRPRRSGASVLAWRDTPFSSGRLTREANPALGAILRPMAPEASKKKPRRCQADSVVELSANRVFENHGDDCGDACGQGYLASQHD